MTCTAERYNKGYLPAACLQCLMCRVATTKRARCALESNKHYRPGLVKCDTGKRNRRISEGIRIQVLVQTDYRLNFKM